MAKRFAIIGAPVSHSLSPLMHSTAFQAIGLDATYEAIEVQLDALEQTTSERLRVAYDGWNVTMPNKQKMAMLVDELHETAKLAGAVNTVVRNGKRLTGFNTDVEGVVRSLAPHISGRKNVKGVLIGSGGASRAVIAGLYRLGICSALTLIVRSVSKTQELLTSMRTALPDRYDILTVDSAASLEALSRADLIIQATPVGMEPSKERSPVSESFRFGKGQLVFDLIYRPRTTKFLKQAREAGATTLYGLDMFLYQGAAAFELWTGKQMPIEVVRPVIEAELAKG